MSLFRRDTPPPTEAWETLREWANHSWWQRYRSSLLVMLPFTTFIIGIAGIALLVAEPSWRTAQWVAAVWAIGVPLTNTEPQICHKLRSERYKSPVEMAKLSAVPIDCAAT